MNPLIFLIRHGETAWSLSGQHTSFTDIPLNGHGETQARTLAPRLKGIAFTEVLCSPRQRARDTCELAGCAASMRIDAQLQEWNYGEYEGLKLAQILERRPDWDLFRDGCPGGESPAEITQRTDLTVAHLRAMNGAIALFSHGHLLRSLAARWLNLPLTHARSLLLAPGSLSLLTFEHDNPAAPAIALWNEAGASLRSGH
jgi:broad specificity phosphatase PhoE